MPVERTPQVSIETIPLGQGERDVEWQLTLNAEQFKRLYPEIKYYPLNRTETYVDPVYTESKTKVFIDRPVLVPVLVVIGPQDKLLKKYGIEEEQEAVAVFCNRVNTERGIDPTTGDRMEYYAILYEVLTVKHTDYISNTQVPLNKVVTLRQINDSPAGDRVGYLVQVDP